MIFSLSDAVRMFWAPRKIIAKFSVKSYGNIER